MTADPVAWEVAGLVAAVTLLIYPWGHNSFDVPKFAIWMGGIGAICAAVAHRALRGKPFWLVAAPPVVALLICMMWAELSAMWASSDLIPRRVLGDWWVFFLTVLLVAHAVWASRRGSLWWAPIAFVAMGVIVGFWTLGQDFGILHDGTVSRLEDWRGLIGASLGNTTHTADLYAMAIAVGLFLFLWVRGIRGTVLATAALVIIAAAMTVSFSFHSSLSLILWAPIALVGIGKRGRRLMWRRKLRIGLLLALWAGMLAFYLSDVPGNPHRPGLARQASSSDRLAWGWDSRLIIWSNSLEMVRVHPLLGWGIGCFTHGYPQQHAEWIVQSENPRIASMTGNFTNAAHSVELQIWAEQGIIGLALWVIMFALHFQACGRLMRHRRRRIRIAGLWLCSLTIMWLLQGQMNFPMQMPVGRMMLALLIGIAAGLDAKTKSPAPGYVVPLALRFRGWRCALLTVIAIALAIYPIHACWKRLRTQGLMKPPYEASRFYVALRDSALGQGVPAIALARFTDDPVTNPLMADQPPLDVWGIVEGYQAVVAYNPGHTDAQSGLHGMLTRMGTDYLNAALALPVDHPDREIWREQGERLLRASIRIGHEVMRGLQVADLYRQMALAHEALGETEAANQNWIIYFERWPIAMRGPDFQRLIRQPEFRALVTADSE